MKRNVVAWAALVVSIATLVGSRSYTRPLPAAQDIPAEGQQTAKALSEAFNAVAEFVAPSVVQINTESKGGLRLGRRGNGGGEPGQTPQVPKDLEEMLKKFFGDQLPEGFEIQPQQFVAEGTGSGFLYDDKGHILTNAHVVEGAEKIVVTFHDGVELNAEVVGTNAETDVAVIKVDTTDYRAVKVGDSKGLKVGEWVLALGSPFGLDHTVTAGIISATQRQEVGINRFEAFIQTDAAINPGNSGGPLVDMQGRVVGINSAIATASRSNSGVGFAIPISMAKRIADKLIKDGEVTPLLMGITIEPVDRALARQLGLPPNTQGVLVTDVGKGTPAEKAGLKVGDVITSYDSQPVLTRQGLQYLVTTSEANQNYKLTYLRGGDEQETTVSPAPFDKVASSLNDRLPRLGGTREKPAEQAEEVAGFGFSVSPITPELAEKHEWSEDAQGLVVTKVDPDGPAAASGMEVGDLVTRVIKDKSIAPVKSLADVKNLASGSEEIAVYVEDVNKRLPGQFMTLKKDESPKKSDDSESDSEKNKDEP